MWTIVTWIVIAAVLAALAAVAAVFVKAYISGESPSAVLFKPRIEPRLSVVEFANVDGKRKLILIRRDDVEHLIMTGGPVDMVVETGIGDGQPLSSAEPFKEPATFRETATFKEAPLPAASTAVFGRSPRSLGQVPQTTVEEVEAALKR